MATGNPRGRYEKYSEVKHVKAEAKTTSPNAKAESTNGSHGITGVTPKKLLASLHWSILQNYLSGYTAIPKIFLQL